LDLEHLGIHRLALPTPYPVGDINVYLLAGSPAILVDAGVYSEESLGALEKGIARAGLGVEEIGAIVLTHHHHDHAGAAFFLSREWGVPVHASRRTFDFMRANPFRHPAPARFLGRLGIPRAYLEAWRNRPATDRYARPDMEPTGEHTLGSTMELGGRRLTVIETPGHSPDHVAFVLEEERIMLSGDHVLPTITPNPLLYFDPADGYRRCRSLLNYQQSLRLIAPFADCHTLPGHGEPMVHAAAALETARRFTQRRSRAYAGLLGEMSPATVFELTRAHFGQREPIQLYLCISETLAHLDLLEQQGVAEVDWEGTPVTVRRATSK